MIQTGEQLLLASSHPAERSAQSSCGISISPFALVTTARVRIAQLPGSVLCAMHWAKGGALSTPSMLTTTPCAGDHYDPQPADEAHEA